MIENDLNYVLNFQRREYKFYMPHSRIESLIPHILQVMDLDPYSKKAGGYYGVYSVYYDTEDWQAYYEKMDGIERRKKFRVRSYIQNPNSDDIVMIEIKEKNKDVILKRRAAIKYRHIMGLGLGKPYSTKDKVYDEWRYNVVRNSLKPRILVAYKRMAFVPKEQSDLRITIDKHVKHSMINKVTMFNAPLVDTGFSRDMAVLEIKFQDQPPKFVNDLIRKYNLNNEAISKFCESVITNNRRIL